MIKINNYQKDTYSFYKELVSSKRNTEKNPTLKEELLAIAETQQSLFQMYDEKFQVNSLVSITSSAYPENEKEKENLKSLYNYRNTKIQKLKNSLTIHPLYKNTMLNTCQNCTINEVDTMDHVLAKTKFPEFSIHPMNLFPCCSVCNKKKSDNYIDDNSSQLFLNLYLDDLPQSQYLYVKFGDNWLPSFYLKQTDDIPDNIFTLISNHYDKLDLLNRFRDSSNEIISTLRATIRTYNKNEIKQKIEEICLELEPKLGYNHRQIVLYRALSSSDDFISDCLN